MAHQAMLANSVINLTCIIPVAPPQDNTRQKAMDACTLVNANKHYIRSLNKQSKHMIKS